METHLPILQVVVPLMAAPLCLLLRRRTLVAVFTLVVTWATFLTSVLLLLRVLDQGPLSYEIGGWPPPWGIEYRVDILSAFVLVLVSGIGAMVMTYAPASLSVELPDYKRHYLFYTVFLLSLTGLLGITITGDLFNVFVFLEISALSSYVLISMGQDRRALTSAFQYLVMGTLGATFILIGIGLLYMMTGTLNMADMAVRVAAVRDTRTIVAAFAFLTVGISLKMALFPLHLWLPNAYTYAPSVVTAFIAATATKVAVYVMLRFFLTVFGVEFSFHWMPLSIFLMPLALVAVVTASLVAIFQNNIKRMLAYSSVAQIGYIVLGISFGSVNGLTGAIVHLFNHGLMKCALFLAMGCIFLRRGSVHIDDFRGLGRSMPLTMGAFVVGGLSLVGTPLTVGFISKWYLVVAALEQGLWPVAVLVLISSLLAVVYIWRVVEVAYFKPPPAVEGEGEVREAPLSMLIPMWLLVAAIIYFGTSTDLTAGVARMAAESLLGAAP
ncbi:MAG: monovalent cation/H+ antiporter subunit D family protein [Acidobacteriota bacterium]